MFLELGSKMTITKLEERVRVHVNIIPKLKNKDALNCNFMQVDLDWGAVSLTLSSSYEISDLEKATPIS